MTPCCVRLTISTSRTCGSISPGRNPRSMMPMPAFLGLDDRHRRAGDRVHVGRHDRPLERDPARHAARQIDRRRIAAHEHAPLRRQDEVVERAAAHELERLKTDGSIDPGKGGHEPILQAYWNSRAATRDRDRAPPAAGQDAARHRSADALRAGTASQRVAHGPVPGRVAGRRLRCCCSTRTRWEPRSR